MFFFTFLDDVGKTIFLRVTTLLYKHILKNTEPAHSLQLIHVNVRINIKCMYNNSVYLVILPTNNYTNIFL